MYRYLALLWNAADERSAPCARSLAERLEHGPSPRWSSVMEATGVGIFHAGRNSGASDACLLPTAAGAVLGRDIHARHREPRVRGTRRFR